jgi:FAD/FMN-containing dehydrogenase
MRKHGLTIDSLVAAELVLADGGIVTASEDEHPDLFWALRGGGGDFGVVTRFDYRAHPVGPLVLAGVLAYPWERAGEAMRAARELMDGAPDELTTFAVLLTAPPMEPFPSALQGRPAAVISVAWCGDLEAGERYLAPLRAAHPPALDLVGPMPYVALQTMLDATAPHHFNYYDRLHNLDAVGDDLIETLIAGYEDVPMPLSHIITGWMGAAVGRVPMGATAFGHRDAQAEVWFIGCSADGPIDPVAAWVKRLHAETARFATGGTYVNALEAGGSPRDAYADEVYERLVAVKRRYDPDGVLAGNGIS